MRRMTLALGLAALCLAAAEARAEDRAQARIIVGCERQKALSDLLVAAEGKLVQRESIPEIRAFVLSGKKAWASLPASALAKEAVELARASGIELAYVEADAVSHASGSCCGGDGFEKKDPAYQEKRARDLAWPRRSLGLDDPSCKADAKGTIVAVLDTGIDATHPALAGSLLEIESLLDGETDPQDRNGHGTAVAGVLVASGTGPLDPRGIAQGARILSLKVMDDRGTGDVATLARGIVRAADRRAKVILASAGVASSSRVLEDAVRYARSQGAIVVAAAGNEPVSRVLFPAGTPGVLAVAASRPGGKAALAGAIDSTVELAAPGEEILTTLPRNVMGGRGVLAGSSLSAAFAAGVAALEFGTGASPDQVLATLRGARRPIAVFAPVARFLPLGELDARLSLARLSQADRALEAAWAVPEVARAGGALRVRARVRSTGGRAAAPGNLNVALGGEVLARAALPALPADGTAVEVDASVTLPETLAPGAVLLQLSLDSDDDATNNARALALPLLPKGAPPVARVLIAGMRIDDERKALVVSLENSGEQAEPELTVSASADGAPLVLAAPCPGLAPGARAELGFALPARESSAPVRFVARARGKSAPEVAGGIDARTSGADPRPVRPQYQQSNGIDIVSDAPWRVEPKRPHVPVMIFVPSKGDAGHGIDLKIEKAQIRSQDDPAATTGTVLYKYDAGVSVAADPTRYAVGTELVDEDGKGLPGGSLNLFLDEALTENGRHEIVRFPRSAFGVADSPAESVTKYLDVSLSYTAHRSFFFGLFTLTDTGTFHKVLKVELAKNTLPVLPGAGRYYDTHVHSIAEWYFSSMFDLLAPRKNYGGPIVMLRDSAYTMGLTDSLDPKLGTLITTDHSCFYNSEDPDANTADRRPPVGPSSAASSTDSTGKVKDQMTRYRELFGITANEELAFDQPQKMFMLDIPIGAHALSFRTSHWEERWNGGEGGASPNERKYGKGALPLKEVISTLSTLGAEENKDAFIYSAHYMSGQGWNDDSLEEGLELTPGADGLRTGKGINEKTLNFVVKGHQLWNGRSGRELPTSKIDWTEMNPWTNDDWKKGRSASGRGLELGLEKYHEQVAKLLSYARTKEPHRYFPRKLYVAAGSDAHGDFNFSDSRLATPIPLSSTFSCDDNAFGKARTWVFADEMDGATDADKAMNALARGCSCVTDGPLAKLAFDANGHFDSLSLAYHAGSMHFENEDGRIGGSGKGPDGGRTALVVAHASDALFGFRYEDSPEGAVTAIELYKDEAGVAPKTRKVHDDDNGDDYSAPAPAGTLPLLGASVWNEAKAADACSFAFDKLCAVQLGVFAGGDPSKGALGPEVHRCYTNPIWIAPVSVEWVKHEADTAAGAWKKGSLVVRFHFPLSMNPKAYKLEVKATDGAGSTTDGTVAGISMAPTSETGWSLDETTGIENGVFEVANVLDVSLAQADYPSPGTATFVVYWKDVPEDSFGNELNRIAVTTTGGSGPVAASKCSRAPSSGTFHLESIASTKSAAPAFLGGGGGGGCEIDGRGSSGGAGLLPLLVLVLGMALARRSRFAL
ncbi:S8 family serine peptidase [bacterium]|nr:S8 family serine peptidase [bacterium]